MNRLLASSLAIALSLVPSVAEAAAEPDDGFGGDGIVDVELLDELGPIAVDDSGRTVVVGVHGDNIAFARYLSDGSPDTTFSGDGRADTPLTVAILNAVDIRVLADGSIVAAGERTTDAMDPFSNGLWAAKVTDTGQPAGGYGTNGVATEFQGYTIYAARGSIAPNGSVVIVQVASGSGNGYSVVSSSGVFGTDGGLEIDSSVLPPGCVTGPATGQRIPVGAATVSSTEFVHAVRTGVGACSIDSALMLTRQRLDGSVVWSAYVPAPEADTGSVSNALEIVGGDVFMSTSTGSTGYLRRYALADGSPVNTWGTDGRATIGGGFGPVGGITGASGDNIGIVNSALFTGSPSEIRVERLLADGQTDPSFGRVVAPVGGALTGSGIAETPDGAIVVAAATASQRTLRRFVAGSTPAAVPVTPARVLETRPGEKTIDGQFQGQGQLAAGSTTKIRIAGRGGVPADATAAIVNLTMAAPAAPGFATLYPCTPTVPTASNINYGPGAFIANSVTAKLDANGDVCLFTLAATDALIDVNGYVS